MRVHETGPAGAPIIVFLHGVAASAGMWEAHIHHFAGYRCLRPDFPGFGDSANEPWVSIEDAAAGTADLIRARAGGPAHVVGLSLGGMVAMQLLADAPQLVDHAVIDGASVLPIRGASLAKLAIRLSPPIIKSDLAIATVARSIGVPKQHRAGITRDYRRMSSAAFVAAFTDALDFRQPPRLASAPCKTLFVCGSREPAATRTSQRHLAYAMPNATAAVVPGRWHSWIAGEARLHCRMVEAWINDRPLPPELATTGPLVRSSAALPG
jgi:pimeloyl-ACP methyl ester carboxylesterase